MTASPSLNLQATETLGAWLRQENISLAFSTYQTNRLILLGTQEEGRLALQERLLDKPMGMFATENGFYLSCRYQIWQFENRLQPGETYEGADRLYIPSRSFTTGGVNVHDVALDQTGQLLFVNTDFSCLAALERGYSFKPLWRPPFIRKLASEDSCHLNGLAVVEGVPTYMSVCSLTPEPAGWRHHRHGGGAVFHLPSNEIVARGLSMPHSPRYYRDQLWLLNSGTGELGYIDQEKLVPVAFCPGFVRGLAFWKHWAILGLSKLRSAHFTGLPLEERLAQMGQVPQCGLMVVNLETGAIEQSLILGGTVDELYDVLVLPGVRRPKALGFQDEDIERLVNFPGAPGLITTKPALKRNAKGPAPPVPGLPTQERLRQERPFSPQDLKYQRVYHLNPESLLPYDDMTYPSLAERWRRQEQRGELVGVSVSLWGELLGFVIGEKLPFGDAQLVEIISFKVDARYRRRGLGKELMATLERQLAKEGIAQLTLTYDAHPQICQSLEPLLAQLGWAPPQDLNAQQKRCFKPLGAGLTPSLEALFAQGTAAAERGDAAQAVAYYQQALTLDPQSAPIHCNLGVLWQQQGRFSEALQAYLRALELKPDLIQGYQNLTALDLQAPLGALSPEERIFLLTTLTAGSLEFGFYDQAQQAFQTLETLLLAPATELSAASAQKLHQYLLFNLPYLRDDPAANSRLSFLVGRAYRRLCLECAPAPEANPGDSLRIGVMSRHFRRHSVAWCSRAILQAWSELTLHLFLYQTGPAPADDLTQQLQTLAPQFTDLSRQAPEERLAKLRADRLDILIDLDSLMNFNHAGILSQPPAPVTVSWLGCEPPFISENNYYLCDRQTHPEGSQQYYQEQLLYLPHCGVALEEFPVQSADPQRRRQELGIAPDTVVYLSPAPGKKLTPELVKAQVAILQRVPNSVLLHKGYGHPAARALYPEACAGAGVAPQRCRFLGRQRWEEEHRVFYQIADVGLDTYPYNGGTHNLEFLWFNVPLVTRRGEQAPSRFGYGFLASLGIGEGVAQSWDEYIDWGVRYGADPELRQAVRERLQQSKATAALWRPREWAEDAYRLFEELLKKKRPSRGGNPALKELRQRAKELQILGQIPEAITAYEDLLTLAPDLAPAHCNLGALYQQEERFPEALQAYRRALELQPELTPGHRNLGQLLAQTGDLTGAEAALETWLKLEGRTGAAYLDLGNLWRSLGENERAMAAFRAAIRQAPDCAEAYQNLGALLMLQGQFALGARCCQKTLALQPDALGALTNLGECQLAQGEYAAALQTYERTLAQAPDHLNILYAYEYLRLRLCDWQDYSARVAALEARLVSYWQDPANPRLLPLVINSFGFPMALHRLQARHWSQGILQSRLSLRRWDGTTLPPWNGKLKLGYISADFRTHAVGTLIQDLFQYHDRSRIEVYAYSLADAADEITEKIRAQCDHWINLAPLSPRAGADRIQGDGIHILIDLAGYTALSRSDILALQPAPLQIAYLGYPDTTGAEFIQYILADRQLIPPELEPYYTETLLPLSHSFVTSAWEIPPPTLTRRDLGLPESAVVFACFNRSDKFDPDTFAIWVEILTAVPGAVLWFMEEVAETQTNLRGEAARLGLDPQRLVFTPKLPWADFVGVCALADLFLDTPRYNAGATALCALQAGLPVLTCPGQSYASRMGASINTAAGLRDLICEDLQQYKTQAIALAQNPQQLGTLKRRLQTQKTQLPLFQPQPWVKALETKLLELWRDYPAQARPQT